MRYGLPAMIVGSALFGASAFAQELLGSYALQTPTGPVTLVLERRGGDEVEGTLSGNGSVGTIRGRLEKDLLIGTIAFGPQSLYLRAYLEDVRLHVDLAELDASGGPVWSAARSLVFEPGSGKGKPGPGAPSPKASRPGAGEPSNPFARKAAPAAADPLAGSWVGEEVALNLEGSQGRYSGRLESGGEAFPVELEGGPDGFRGVLREGGEAFPFQGRIDGGSLVLESGQGAFRLARAEASGGSPAGVGAEGNAERGGNAERNATSSRSVVINGRKLPEETLAALERGSQVRIGDGAYWYDRSCGGWGVAGGPMLGAIPAGLDLGGPLAADASGGGTGVFINGRELHPYDVMALQRLGSVMPGRYWVDGSGNGGYEGGPAIFNLVEAARRAGGGGSKGPWSHHTKDGDAHVGGDGQGFSYFMDKDVSWSSGG